MAFEVSPRIYPIGILYAACFTPEAVAKYTGARTDAASIKGLIVDPAKLSGGEIEDLGVKHAAYSSLRRRQDV